MAFVNETHRLPDPVLRVPAPAAPRTRTGSGRSSLTPYGREPEGA